eukprot:6670343-Pyramimonas_sp.AAC.1
MQLTFSRGRWFTAKWGRSSFSTHSGGARLAASFNALPGESAVTLSPTTPASAVSPTNLSSHWLADAGPCVYQVDDAWRNLTHSLSAAFCSSLNFLADSPSVGRPAFSPFSHRVEKSQEHRMGKQTANVLVNVLFHMQLRPLRFLISVYTLHALTSDSISSRRRSSVCKQDG